MDFEPKEQQYPNHGTGEQVRAKVDCHHQRLKVEKRFGDVFYPVWRIHSWLQDCHQNDSVVIDRDDREGY